MMKKLITAILVLCMLIAMTACHGEPASSNDGNGQTNTPPVAEPAENLAEDTLHKVTVTESDRPFATDRATDYVLAVGEGSLNNRAAAFISSQVMAATGAALEVVEGNTVAWSENVKCIFLNCPEQFAQAGLTMPQEDIGPRGYYIKSVGDSVFIATKAETGAQLGAIAFLRHVLGYDMISDDMAVYSKDGSTLPDMDIIERPDYDFYTASNKMNDQAVYGMGYQQLLDVFINITSQASSYGPFHNSLDYLPMDAWYESHPDWYSDVTFNDGTGVRRELCYTAHGNAEELEAMANEIAQRMILEAGNNPNIATVCLTIEDHTTICSCNACTASSQKYNGSNSAAVIQLLNRVNEKVQAALQADADKNGTQKREFSILFFAYHKMLKAPAVQNADGTWSPVDESVVCAPEVGVFYAPIEIFYTYSIHHENNAEHKQNTEAWAACTNKIYMWTYCANFGFYMFPYNTFDTMIENYRFFKSYGATYMFNQGQHNQSNPTGFAAFKEYLSSHALFDVNVDLSDLTDTFFPAYFREGSDVMLQYYNELQAHLYSLADIYPVQLNGYVREEIDSVQYWPRNTLVQWLGYIDEAYAAVEKYQQSDPELYDILRSHITQESIFPRYAMLELHANYYQADELLELRKAFKNDCESLGITRVSEHIDISTVFAQWGIL